MPRYFFNTRVGDELIADPDGEELRDPDQAWEVARTLIRQLLQDEGSTPDLLRASLEVTDEAGDIVLEFPFSEALIDSPEKPRTH
jgi:hypothetical protein